MIRCYLIAMCRWSSIDEETRTLSLFNIVEDMQVAPFAPRAIVQVELHTHFICDPGDVGTELEVRHVWTSENGEETVGQRPNTFTMSGKKVRVRGLSISLPNSVGQHTLSVEWRRVGSDEMWHRSEVSWPVGIQEVAVPPST